MSDGDLFAIDTTGGDSTDRFIFGLFCSRRQQAGQIPAESLRCFGHRDMVLRTARPGETRSDGRKIKFERFVKKRLRGLSIMEKPLRSHILLHQLHTLGRTAGKAQVFKGFIIHREDRTGRTVFRRHVADGGTVGHRQTCDARTEKFNEFADHTMPAQFFGDGQNQIRGGHAGTKTARKPETNHLRDQHGNGLAEHRRFRLDPSDSPAQYAQTVDHRRM